MISFQELLDERSAVDARWLPLAAHEADCAGQPYIGPEHVDLARARHNGDQERYHEPAGALYPLGRPPPLVAPAGVPLGAPEGRHPCHRGGAESGTGQRDPR